MKKLKKQLEKKGYNVALSEDGIEVYDLIDDDYILIELSEDKHMYLISENLSMRVENNLSDILKGLTDFAS